MLPDESTKGLPELEISDRETGSVRYLAHGSPHWRIRWHYHDEYELHLIVASTGKMFVGDYVGSFRPGCLVLTGPRVPHNWVSDDGDGTRHELRDHVLHFNHDTISGAAALLPELRMMLPLMERARHGIEFSRHADIAEKFMLQIKESDGPVRLGYFFELLDILARTTHQELLSATRMEIPATENTHEKIDLVIEHVMRHFRRKIMLAEVAAIVGMSEGHFSRFFHKATGNGFRDFVNRVRVSKACDLLSRTGMAITLICHEVGFSSIANFNRRFMQYKQMTPSEYRKRSRQRYCAG